MQLIFLLSSYMLTLRASSSSSVVSNTETVTHIQHLHPQSCLQSSAAPTCCCFPLCHGSPFITVCITSASCVHKCRLQLVLIFKHIFDILFCCCKLFNEHFTECHTLYCTNSRFCIYVVLCGLIVIHQPGWEMLIAMVTVWELTAWMKNRLFYSAQV